MERIGKADAELSIMQSRVILIRLVESEKLLGHQEAAFCAFLQMETILISSYLLLPLSYVLGRLKDGVINLLIE